MEKENKVSLSQEEVDKLLGISRSSNAKPQIKIKEYHHDIIATEDELKSIQEKFQSLTADLKLKIDRNFSEGKNRKLNVSNVEQISAEEFFDGVSSKDFLYRINFGDATAFVKLDSFLYCALSGMTFDPRLSTNLFQSEVLKNFVVPHFSEMIINSVGRTDECTILSLYNEDLTQLKNQVTGISLSINWNEGLKSFGIEKIFMTQEIKDLMSK